MSNISPIPVSSLTPIVHNGQRVITLSMMDQVHGRPDGTARRNFNANKDRLFEGRHYFSVNLNEFRSAFPGVAPERGGGTVTVLTERGYLLLVKSFNDDLAWQVQEQLVEGYFRGSVVSQNMGLSVADVVDLMQKMVPSIITTTFDALEKRLDQRLDERIASSQVGTAYGVTTGDLLDEFEIKGVRGLSVRMSNILCKRGCQLEGGSRAHMGRRKAKLFHPDKSFQMMRDWLADDCRRYIQERKGQSNLFPLKKAD
jgi:hypothetical protein